MRSILEAIKSILNAIFGGSGTVPKEPTNKPDPRPTTPTKPKDPPIVQPKDEPELPPQPEVPDNVDLGEDDAIIPQDGADIQPDTVVVVVNEKDLEVIEETVNEEAPTTDTKVEEDVFDEAADEVKPTDKPTLPADGSEVDLGEVNTDGGEVSIPDTPEEVLKQHNARYLWCLDNGHGRLTRGKRSPLFADRKTRFFEYEFNRDIVARIVAKLDEVGVKYFVTVPEVDVDNFLEIRVNRANQKRSILPKIFVSIHSNAAPARSANDWAPASINGIETWHFHGSRRGQTIAGVFQKHLLAKTGWKNRHLKSRPSNQFYVLRKTRMPAVLTENGFYNNKQQVAELMKPAVRQKIADAHVAAILELEEKGIEGVGLMG